MTSKTHVPLRAGRAPWAVAALLLAAPQARAAEVWLRAGPTSYTPPGGASVAMWGYAECGPAFTGCGAVTVPGPALAVPAADAGLTVHLQNGLSEPTSIVIPGQTTVMTPVWFEPSAPGTTYLGSRPAGNVTARVRSFTHEAPAGGTADYVWPGLRPGTYLYQSGTHPQVQVQMGLYGALTRNAADAAGALRAQAYSGVEYDQSVTVLYSEIDPALHAAVGSGSYGTATGPTSTFDYQPRYFLVNGAPYQAGAAPIATVGGGQRILLRFLNAGLRTHVPMLLGQHLDLIAEDGNPYPWPDHPRQQYTVQLPAAKTVDAVMAADNPGTTTIRLAILDRRLDVTNAGAPDGGLISFLAVTAGTAAAAPVITSSPPTTALVGAAYAYQVVASDANPGDTLTYSLDAFPAGMTISATGLVTWTPDTAGTFPVAVRVTDPGGLFATQAFSVVVSAVVNHAPVAVADGPYTMVELGTLSVAAPGVLANDTDPDGDALTAVNFSAATGLSGSASGAFTWTLPPGAGARTFTYQAQDASLTSAPATVTVNVLANRAPVTVADSATAPRRTRANSATYAPVQVTILANDSDPDTALDPANAIAPATVVISAAPNQGGTATVNPTTGVVSYVPPLNFRGTDTFSYRVRDSRGALSSAANVRVNVR